MGTKSMRRNRSAIAWEHCTRQRCCWMYLCNRQVIIIAVLALMHHQCMCTCTYGVLWWVCITFAMPSADIWHYKTMAFICMTLRERGRSQDSRCILIHIHVCKLNQNVWLTSTGLHADTSRHGESCQGAWGASGIFRGSAVSERSRTCGHRAVAAEDQVLDHHWSVFVSHVL